MTIMRQDCSTIYRVFFVEIIVFIGYNSNTDNNSIYSDVFDKIFVFIAYLAPETIAQFTVHKIVVIISLAPQTVAQFTVLSLFKLS
jgi:hypothetical protein